jgi:aminoglycoside phosphotransferase (APT) family kinase protein/adenylate kinase family enzyme
VRLVIIGNSSSGKSSYAAQLARLHDLAHFDLDTIAWEPKRIAVPRPAAAARAELERFIAEHERWVVEGCYADLAGVATATCTELVFMNPGVEACLANAHRRPWEPHKYNTADDQQLMLAHLLEWIEAYSTRDDATSYAAHRRLFDAHPGPKRELDADAVAIVHAFPQLDTRGVARIDGGWTSATFEVGERIVQLARTPYAAETLRHQMRVLPLLAPRLGVAIPQPELVSVEPVAIAYRKLAGEPCDRAPARAGPEQLGRFVRELHAIAPADLGLAPLTVAEFRARVRADLARMRAHVAPRLSPAERARADALVAALVDDDRNWRFELVVTHGDLGPEHVLVDPAGALAAVIDWEDVGAGDPAGDFAWWLHAMPSASERALAAYGVPSDERFRARAAGLFAVMPWHDVEHGVETGDPESIAAGLAGIRACLP